MYQAAEMGWYDRGNQSVAESGGIRCNRSEIVSYLPISITATFHGKGIKLTIIQQYGQQSAR
jgi:hypothetical protein